MKETSTVKIFLVLGEPDSVRTAEISNWTGKAVAGPRTQLDLILQRDEAMKPGVYFLTGINPETGKQRVYIGEAEVVRARIKYPSILRFQLISEGVLIQASDKLVFTKDYEFSSPSAAASVIHGGHANGLREWKDINGVSLKELEQKDVANKTMDSDEE